MPAVPEVQGSGIIVGNGPGPFDIPDLEFDWNTTPVTHLTFNSFTGASALALWDWGDNTPRQQMAVPDHVYASAGTFHVTRYNDATGPTALDADSVGGMRNVNVTKLVNLVDCNLTSNNPIGSVTATGLTHLTTLRVSDTEVPALSLTGLSALSNLFCNANDALTSLNISPCPLMKNIGLNGSGFNTAAVDSILVTLAAGSVSNGSAQLSTFSGSNPPSPTGLSAELILLGRGWSVSTD